MNIATIYTIILILYIIVLFIGIAFYNEFIKLQKKFNKLNDSYEKYKYQNERSILRSNERVNSKMDKLAKNFNIEYYRKGYEELDNIEKKLFDEVCNIPYNNFKEVINKGVEYYIFKTDYKGIKVEVLYYPNDVKYMYSTFAFLHKINGKEYKCATIGYIYGFIEYINSLRIERNNKIRKELEEKIR